MTIEETTVIDFLETDSEAPVQSIREYLGLKVEHLLPGLEIAANMLRRGDHEQALRTYATLVLCDPSEIQFQIGLANCALEIKEFHVAFQAASAIVSFSPDNPAGYLISGQASLGMLDFDAAIEDLEEAIRLAELIDDTITAQEAEGFLKRALLAKEVRSKD